MCININYNNEVFREENHINLRSIENKNEDLSNKNSIKDNIDNLLNKLLDSFYKQKLDGKLILFLDNCFKTNYFFLEFFIKNFR